MSALHLIYRCRDAGISLEARGDRLHVEAPAGTVTPELRQRLVEHKAELLALHAIRARLQVLAVTMGIPRTVVESLPLAEFEAIGEQVGLCEGYMDGNGDPLAPALLIFYLKVLTEREGRHDDPVRSS